MADTEQKELELDAIEADDGSAVVEIDPKLLVPEESEEQNGFERAKDGGEVADSSDDDHPNDDPELREAKRNRRRAKKDLIRKTNQEKDVRLMQLQRENQEFKQRLNQLERNTKTEGLMRIDKGIEDAETRLEYAKLKIAEATQNQDGQGMVDAQTLLQQANEEVRHLNNLRHQANQELKRPQQKQQNQEVDPEVQRNAQAWMRRNSWYNPQTNDPDSRIAKRVDEIMGTQGWDPSDPDYWDELDARLQKELPHRYNGNNDDDNRNVRRPRNVVGSSGREASAAYGGSNRSQFVLSPDRVRAMKEAGAWDNPERKAKMIKQFIAYDRSNRNN
jgi:hypothetical protein